MELFSNRDKPLPDVYTYEEMPNKLKGQLTHIVEELCDLVAHSTVQELHNLLLREWGRRAMVYNPRSPQDDIVEFMLGKNATSEHILDLVELMLRFWLILFKNGYREELERTNDNIDEINDKFRLAGFGYEFVDDRFIRIDSQLAHKQIVKPALLLLADIAYSVADSEYRSSHEHFRHGRYAECLVDCCKAFESVMKVICQIKYGVDKSKETVGSLVAFLKAQNFFPEFLGEHINQFTGMLTSTVNPGLFILNDFRILNLASSIWRTD